MVKPMPTRLIVNFRRYIVLGVIALLVTGPGTALAASFNPNIVLSDNDLENSAAFSVSRIQSFLESKNSGLANYRTTDPWGNTKSASQIIYDAGRYWRINPQYILVRLQIEQSLTTNPSPTQHQLDWASGYGVCDSCSKDDPAIQQYKGFYNQVNWAARRIRESYLADLETRGYTVSGWGKGITKRTGDGYDVTPANNATAAMYTYTPYVYNANYNLWRLWNEWFTKHYPDGSLLQVQGQPGVYLLQDGKKRPFLTKSALLSRFDPANIIQVAQYDVDLYETGVPIKFPNYSLVRVAETGRIFLIDGDTIRYITSPEVFRQIGFNPEEVVDVTSADVQPYAYGANIDTGSVYPTGVLLQSKENGGISFVENGIRHSIWSREILSSQFRGRNIVRVDQATIDQYASGDPVKFRDGELVTSSGFRSVFVISNGLRRPIASRDAFDGLGYTWDNIIWTSDDAIRIHPLGEPVTN